MISKMNQNITKIENERSRFKKWRKC